MSSIVKALDQLTLTDYSDGYSASLSNESHSLVGRADGTLGTTMTISTQASAYCGPSPAKCSIDVAGLESSNAHLKATVTNNDPASGTGIPVISFTAEPALSGTATVKIPILISDGKNTITINKIFTCSITKQGIQGEQGLKGDDGTSVTIKSTSVTYVVTNSGTAIPGSDAGWSADIKATTKPGEFLWTKTHVEYNGSNNSTTSYSVSAHGARGPQGDVGPKGDNSVVTGTILEYAESTNGTSIPNSGWQKTIPNVVGGNFLWTKTTNTYNNGKSSTSYNVAKHGEKGDKGEDSLQLTIETDKGNVFRNNTGETTLTVTLRKGGAPVSSISSYGTLKWYKNDVLIPANNGKTSLKVTAADVDSKAVYSVKLEK